MFLNAQQNREYNYGLSESIEFYPNRGYLNPNALAARYKKLIKYKVLSLYLQQADSLTSKAAVDSKKLEALKEEAIEWELCWIQNKLGQDNSAAQYVEACFLKSLSNTFDPHTLYLSPSETDFFNQSLSDESLSFGMELYRNNKGDLVIESLIPGGPAWHSNQFNEGDIIRSIRSDRDSTVELKCIPTKEAVDIIYSDQIRKAVFTIQKMNGEQVESYNKAVAEFNEEIKKYNETNEFTNKKRAKTIEYWNQEVEKFFERNTN